MNLVWCEYQSSWDAAHGFGDLKPQGMLVYADGDYVYITYVW